MNKEHILYGIIGILVGIIIGYIGTNTINQSNPPASQVQTAAQNPGNLPPDHPPTGATETTGSEERSGGNTAGDPQSEVTDIIKKARQEPSNYEAQMQAAGMFVQINRNEQALEFYDRAYKVKPNDVDLLVKLGDTHFYLEKFVEAEGWYQKALKIKPKHASIRMHLGLTYYLRQPRDLDKAIDEYRKVLVDTPRHEKTLQNLTLALLDKGDKTAARETVKLLEEINPGNQVLAQIRDRLK